MVSSLETAHASLRQLLGPEHVLDQATSRETRAAPFRMCEGTVLKEGARTAEHRGLISAPRRDGNGIASTERRKKGFDQAGIKIRQLESEPQA
jgi:hypothetical protein